ncbi:hypothetical protein F5Y03DRAFT_32522 [Xylaria venustula]|nr:hypothetical protein F5Y03DRAFT_32522 [Xylaria venustula]
MDNEASWLADLGCNFSDRNLTTPAILCLCDFLSCSSFNVLSGDVIYTRRWQHLFLSLGSGLGFGGRIFSTLAYLKILAYIVFNNAGEMFRAVLQD